MSLLLAGCGGGGSDVTASPGGGTQETVPNVVNDTQAAATSALTAAGVALGTVTSQSSTTVASGLVISESPAAGSSVAQGTTVNLVLSAGSVAVPSVVGDAQAAAQSAITAAGLMVGAVTSQASSTVANGDVISENPVAGSGVVPGASVALVVSSGAGGGSAYNVTNAIIDPGPSALLAAGTAAVNVMYVNVTLCAPGSTTNCQTIDHVQVDTGSQGLRILASAITNSSLLSALQPVTINGGTLAECLEFVDGYSWGPVVTTDLHIGGSDTATTGESAPGIPMQIIGTTTYPVPADCSSNAVNTTPENTVAEFGANGIIGIGLFDEDCGTVCESGSGLLGVENGNGYFSCTNTGCAETFVPAASQLVNPVHALATVNGVTDNNGVIIELPAVDATGAATVTGTLVFGISTQSNNTLSPSATVLTTTSYTGFVTTGVTSLGQTDMTSYLDSGTNAVFFNDSSILECTQASNAPGFFCPASSVNLSATITGVNNQVAPVNFSVGNANTLFTDEISFAAFSNLAGVAGTEQGGGTFAWGLPFYFGRNVYTAMENTNAGGTNGPYFAF
jgi:hypothetical protein